MTFNTVVPKWIYPFYLLYDVIFQCVAFIKVAMTTLKSDHSFVRLQSLILMHVPPLAVISINYIMGSNILMYEGSTSEESMSPSSSDTTTPGSDPDDSEDSRRRRAELLKSTFKLAQEVDTGQPTTNPYILVTRHYKEDSPVTLKLLNSILAFHGFSITEAEFNILKGVDPVNLPYPLPNNDAYTHSIAGPTTKQKAKMIAGCYVLSVKEDGKQYVGSSLNLAMRLRTYYNTKTESGRTMAKAMTSLGPSSFSLQVFVLPVQTFKHPMTDTYLAKMILALEQLLILEFKPTLNDMLVVGGGQTKYLEGIVELAASAVNSKGLFVYNSDKSRLVYKANSRMHFEVEFGVNTKTQSIYVKNGTPYMDTYVFTEQRIDGVVADLMTTDQLRESLNVLYQSTRGVKHSVKLTDLRNSGSESITFSSKTKLHAYTVSKGRPVGKTYLTSLPCTHNDWLVEQVSK